MVKIVNETGLNGIPIFSAVVPPLFKSRRTRNGPLLLFWNSDSRHRFAERTALFHHVSQFTERMNYDELKDLILDQIDEKCGTNSNETVGRIWDEKAVEVGRRIVRGYVGDDKRP